MTDEPTRYARAKETAHQKQRHETIVRKLSRPVAESFAEAVEKDRPPCVKAGLPSKWVDWATDPSEREDYETEPPTKSEAEKMCADCPLTRLEDGGNGLCGKYARATGQSHGVWGGERRENGKWLDDIRRPTARRITNE